MLIQRNVGVTLRKNFFLNCGAKDQLLTLQDMNIIIFIQFVLQTNTLHENRDQYKGQTNKHIVQSNRRKRLAN